MAVAPSDATGVGVGSRWPGSAAGWLQAGWPGPSLTHTRAPAQRRHLPAAGHRLRHRRGHRLYVHEAVALLARQGRSLVAALWTLTWTYNNFALLNGTLVRTNRIRAYDRRYYSGQHRHYGINLQGLTDPSGRLIWISDGLPGSTHDLSAARAHGVFDVADRARLYLYADKGYAGGEGATLLTPYKGRNLPDSYRQVNRCHAAIRANAERSFAVLKTWKIFDRYRGCPRRVGAFARAVLTLEHGPNRKIWKGLSIGTDEPLRRPQPQGPIHKIVLGALGGW